MRKLINSWLKKIKRTTSPFDFGSVRSLTPASKIFGFDRGTPIDRYYIDSFLKTSQQYIKGAVLEIAESTYSKQFDNGVTKFEVLHYTADNKDATIIGDLSNPETLPSDAIDCFICTQTLNFISDFESAIKGIHQVLKPGGVALVTVAGLTQISRYDMDRWGDFWRFTTLSIKNSFEKVFGTDNITVESLGNVLSATALLHGLASEELKTEELDFNDPDYQITITVIAKK